MQDERRLAGEPDRPRTIRVHPPPTSSASGSRPWPPRPPKGSRRGGVIALAPRRADG